MFKAVLFDLDGTLLNTIDDLADAMNATMAAMGYSPHTVSECKHFIGDGVRMYCFRALPSDRRDNATVSRAVEIYRGEYAKRWADKTRPYDGIPDLLDAITARGIAMAVLSNKPHDFTRVCVERFLPKWTFASVVGEGPGVAKKPDPGGALAIAERLGAEPGAVLYVGDTNTDMDTAAAAGMYAVGALWGFRSADELLAHGARTLIAHPMDLMKLL